MIALVFIAVHIAAVAYVIGMHSRKKLHIDPHFLIIAILVPLAGPVGALLISYLDKKNMVGKKAADLGDFAFSPGASTHLSREKETVNTVPLQDALIMDDAGVRRNVILDVLMSGAGEYLPVLNEARMNDDVEVVHYATTAMVEVSKEYEIKQQEYSVAYAENPGDIALLDEYIAFMKQYLSSGMLQGQILEIQRNTYGQLISNKIALLPNPDDYERLVYHYLEVHDYNAADSALSRMEELYPSDERTWILRFRYCVETRSADQLRNMIKEIKNSKRYYSVNIRRILDYWDDAKEVHV